jgi:hypothetical protein
MRFLPSGAGDAVGSMVIWPGMIYKLYIGP